MFKIPFRFHLMQCNNILKTEDGRQKKYVYKSYGGFLFILWMLFTFIFSQVNCFDYRFLYNLFLGILIIFSWNVITFILYVLNMCIDAKKITKGKFIKGLHNIDIKNL